MRVVFVLVCEGTSDAGLVPHLRDLCVRCGATEAIGSAPDMTRLRNPPEGLRDRLTAALDLEPSANLVFAHRDADEPTEDRRIAEIETASQGLRARTVPVVPVQETEAWLLLDEAAIRSVVENPSSPIKLALPRPQDVERVADPKRKLKEVLNRASGLRGRRLKALKQDFPRRRARLLERLDRDGLLRHVPAWQRLERRTREALGVLQSGSAHIESGT
jgi:hypothetical protein